MSNATNFYTYLALLAAVRRSLLSDLAAWREVRSGVFSDNRNNLCNNNYNFFFASARIASLLRAINFKKKLSGLATLREIRSGLFSDNRNNL